MKDILPISELTEGDVKQAGGKAVKLAMLTRAGLRVPPGLCLTARVYRRYLRQTGLGDRIALELGRKAFAEMRWEEIWDASLRIRNMFLAQALPTPIEMSLRTALAPQVAEAPVVVRSSSPAEDSARCSFAGLHESFVNVRGLERVLECIRLVWASLWSDRALLYRRELGLDVHASAMAVIIQPIVVGRVSGIAFSRHPVQPDQALIEAVYGLNEGLVSGEVEPDRWSLDRRSGAILEHTPPTERRAALPRGRQVKVEAVPGPTRNRAPLDPDEVDELYHLSRDLEKLFNAPQDTEWTQADAALHVLQTRPVTVGGTADDERRWYISLHRSVENLKQLRTRIEDDILPGMADEADRLAETELAELSDTDLADEIQRRQQIVEQWTKIYWDECIPFAHGARLFGQVYNDAVHPRDPFEFVDLLAGQSFVTTRRNDELQRLARMLRDHPAWIDALHRGAWAELDPAFRESLEAFLDATGVAGARGGDATLAPALASFLLGLTGQPTGSTRTPSDRENKEGLFLTSFEADRREWARQLLDLARASYRLRDDDNIYLGRLKKALAQAVQAGARRAARTGPPLADDTPSTDIVRVLNEPGWRPPARSAPPADVSPQVRARQIVGQPASRGSASGPARVIAGSDDLFAVRAGEILVCDAISPEMTFVVPLAAGLVERRGGMLIHGAIIAREYWIPCVTGVPEATRMIRTGDWLTVDGYLGIVTLSVRQPVPAVK